MKPLADAPPDSILVPVRPQDSHSLSESFASIRVPGRDAPLWRRMLAFAGPGMLVAVGYMDPGNWATDLAGGAQFGYLLLSVVLLSNLMAMLLQHLALKLGIVTGQDLAQACRDHYSKPVAVTLWILCEIAIIACDLAEVTGSAIALNLLFKLPLLLGVILTSADVLLILFLQHRGFRWLESIVGALIAMIGLCFAYEMIVSRPEFAGIVGGLLPRAQVVTDSTALYLGIGIIGATVMPHNLYLHSSIVMTRDYQRDDQGRASAIRFATVDSTVALFFAFFINAAILILSAAAFHRSGQHDVAEIQDAYRLLAPSLGAPLASTVFAVALLASGQNSTLTGTLAGQIVMEGFLHWRIRPWVRRLITRAAAIVPAAVVVAISGEKGATSLIILSQVVLSMQLGFAIVPLVKFTGEREKMGRFANGTLLQCTAWAVTAVIIGLDLYCLGVQAYGWWK